MIVWFSKTAVIICIATKRRVTRVINGRDKARREKQFPHLTKIKLKVSSKNLRRMTFSCSTNSSYKHVSNFYVILSGQKRAIIIH